MSDIRVKEKIAGENFLSGYNCAQAVVLAFSEELGIEKDMLAKAVSGFGGGMGRMREVCGAVSGMIYVLSCLEGYCDPKTTKDKVELYKNIQSLSEKFKEKEGSIICRELIKGEVDSGPIPSPRTPEYYKQRGCKGCVECAAGILENYLYNNK